MPLNFLSHAGQVLGDQAGAANRVREQNRAVGFDMLNKGFVRRTPQEQPAGILSRLNAAFGTGPRPVTADQFTHGPLHPAVQADRQAAAGRQQAQRASLIQEERNRLEARKIDLEERKHQEIGLPESQAGIKNLEGQISARLRQIAVQEGQLDAQRAAAETEKELQAIRLDLQVQEFIEDKRRGRLYMHFGEDSMGQPYLVQADLGKGQVSKVNLAGKQAEVIAAAQAKQQELSALLRLFSFESEQAAEIQEVLMPRLQQILSGTADNAALDKLLNGDLTPSDQPTVFKMQALADDLESLGNIVQRINQLKGEAPAAPDQGIPMDQEQGLNTPASPVNGDGLLTPAQNPFEFLNSIRLNTQDTGASENAPALGPQRNQIREGLERRAGIR